MTEQQYNHEIEQQQQQHIAGLEQTILAATDILEQQLRANHPHFAAYLDMTILARPLWMGGFDVLGQLYGTAEAAEEARRAAVMLKLMEIDRAGR